MNDEDIKKQRGERLKEEFKKKGWNKSEFARRMQIASSNVNKFFEGITDPENLTWHLIENDFDVYYIMKGERVRLVRDLEGMRGVRIEDEPGEQTSPETKLEGTHIGRATAVREQGDYYVTQTQFKSLENLIFIAKYNLENAVQAFTDAESELEKLKVKV